MIYKKISISPVPFLLIAMVLVLGTCANPVMNLQPPETNLSAPGKLLVSVGASLDARSSGPLLDTISRYEILLSGTQSMGPVTTAESMYQFNDLPVGSYVVMVSALDDDGRTLAAGSASDVIVLDGENTEISLALYPTMGGEGSFVFSLDWSEAGIDGDMVDEIYAIITPIGGSPRVVEGTATENGLEITEDLPSGRYTLTVDLYADSDPIYSLEEEITIYEEKSTEVTRSLSSQDISSPPASPANLRLVQSGMTVNIAWTDGSDSETGFDIYRSENGGPYVLIGSGLPANTVAWTDEPMEAGKDYGYRVFATNGFGESDPLEGLVSVAPLVTTVPVVEKPIIPVVPGEKKNVIAPDAILEGAENNLDSAPLEVIEVKKTTEDKELPAESVTVEDGEIVIDASSLTADDEGKEFSVDYVVHIEGTPINPQFTAVGSATIAVGSPEDAEGTTALVFDSEDELAAAIERNTAPTPQMIFDQWGRISNHRYFANEDDADSSRRRGDKEAVMALEWKLKQGRGGSGFFEYAKNFVYAALVTPEGFESTRYSLEATVSSKDKDDDSAGLIVAVVREGESLYLLEAGRSHGSESKGAYIEPREGWGLVVRRLYPGADQPESGEVLWTSQRAAGPVSRDGWNHAETRIRVERSDDRVTATTSDWNGSSRNGNRNGAGRLGNEITIRLTDHPELERFRGPRSYGFFTASQERTSFTSLVFNNGIRRNRMFLLNPDTNASEVWEYDEQSGSWKQRTGRRIQDFLGRDGEVVNPETGKRYNLGRGSDRDDDDDD